MKKPLARVAQGLVWTEWTAPLPGTGALRYTGKPAASKKPSNSAELR